jgi:hypothetical protein
MRQPDKIYIAYWQYAFYIVANIRGLRGNDKRDAEETASTTARLWLPTDAPDKAKSGK